ncbi:D-aminoacyl-tRNA deacylase [Roseivivax sp. CAU 1753]
MRALIQRVTSARVEIEGAVIGEVGPGLMILVCAMQGDGDAAAEKLATKIAKLRLFRDGDGKTNLSIRDVGGAALVISQFTLAADTRRGNRPGFSAAASPADGERLYERFARALQDQSLRVATGRFGAEMQLHLVNDGPMTIWLDTDD